MKFVNVDSRISEENVAASAKMLTVVFASLAVRRDNLHVTGLGGDPEIFHKIMNVPHNLVIGPSLIDTVNGKIDWSVEFLSTSSLESTRTFLNDNRETLLALPDTALPPSFEAAMGACATFTKQIIANKLDESVDNIDRDKVDKFVEELAVALEDSKAEPGMLLMCIREQISIDRMVRFNMDEHPRFSKLMAQVTDILSVKNHDPLAQKNKEERIERMKNEGAEVREARRAAREGQ